MTESKIPALNSRGIRKTVFYKEPGFKLLMMAMPLLILVFVFSYLPLHGWIYAFYDYTPGMKLSECKFVGLSNFSVMFNDPVTSSDTLRVLKNTLGMSILNLLTSVLPVIFAIFLVEINSTKYRKAIQTLTTMPNFISWILVYAFAFSIFSVDEGFVNRLLLSLNLISEPVNFLASSEHVWLTQTAVSIWKGLGWGSIVYLAAITSIDQEQYEAAKVDGASRFQSILHITVPGILPTYFVMLLLAVAGILNNGMQQYFVFQNPMNQDSIEVLDLYIYNKGLANSFTGFYYSFATALGMFKSLISVILLFIVNTASKRVRGYSII